MESDTDKVMNVINSEWKSIFEIANMAKISWLKAELILTSMKDKDLEILEINKRRYYRWTS